MPAGLLQKPFFSSSYPDARNYGSVGAVMAHELTHGFDNVGRRYDQNGRLHNWWAPTDVVAFKKRADCLKIYYSSFTVGGHNVDGDLTLAENIADNGGIKISYEAFLELEQSKGRPATEADKQLFFLSWGQTWCSVSRDGALCGHAIVFGVQVCLCLEGCRARRVAGLWLVCWCWLAWQAVCVGFHACGSRLALTPP